MTRTQGDLPVLRCAGSSARYRSPWLRFPRGEVSRCDSTRVVGHWCIPFLGPAVRMSVTPAPSLSPTPPGAAAAQDRVSISGVPRTRSANTPCRHFTCERQSRSRDGPQPSAASFSRRGPRQARAELRFPSAAHHRSSGQANYLYTQCFCCRTTPRQPRLASCPAAVPASSVGVADRRMCVRCNGLRQPNLV